MLKKFYFKMQRLKVNLSVNDTVNNDKDSSIILKQFVNDIVDFSSQYGSDSSMSYTSFNLIGPPTVYPKYGDYADTFVLRTYGPWWDKTTSASKFSANKLSSSSCKRDFVDVKFEHKVYPLSLDIYETYNPGAVIRILALDSENKKWKVLWDETLLANYSPTKDSRNRHKHHKHIEESRIFSPPIKSTDFPTNILRIEFCHHHLEYYSELDAIMLCGSSIQISTSLNLTTICEKLLRQNLNQTLSIKPQLSLPSTDGNVCSVTKPGIVKNWFLYLPGEVIALMMSYLDLISLCQAACVCKLFMKYCYDPLLYTNLNLHYIWEKVTNNSLIGLFNRCQNLRELNLSWCGNFNHVTSDVFIRFLISCGKNLTCLKVANCQFIDNNSLHSVANICRTLKELDLHCCRSVNLDQRGFQEIILLKNLLYLNVYRTLIDMHCVNSIIRNCQQLEYLNLGSCTGINNFDELLVEINPYCSSLKYLDLWRAKTLTSIGIMQIANSCPLLEELDVGWCMDVSSNSRCIAELCEKCQNLNKLILTAVRSVSDADLNAVATYCHNLEQLDILGTRDTTPFAIHRILLECKKLKLLDISFCAQISDETVQLWKHSFPHVAIKKSFQNLNSV